MSKNKYYVVWYGVEPGIYTTWAECERQVKGCKEAVYKSFDTLAEAEAAYEGDPADYIKRSVSPRPAAQSDLSAQLPSEPCTRSHDPVNPPDYRHDTVLPLPPEVRADALAVDAACSGNPGPMEYRGVYLATGQEVFHYGPIQGTNNIGEFLAIVHALALLEQRGRTMTVYSDSRNALLWIKARKCRTKLARTARTEQVFQLIERAEAWLATHSYAHIPLLKWETKKWGEVPADFGRK